MSSLEEPWICTCGLEMEWDEVQCSWFCSKCMALSEDSGDYVPPHERDDYFWEDLDE